MSGTQVLSDISSSLSLLFGPKLERQFNRQSVLAQTLQKEVGGGKTINWDVRFDRATHAASFTEGADVAGGEFNVDVTQPATLSWGQYRVAFSLSGVSVAAAASSPGSATELLNQFESNLNDAATDLISIINNDLFAGAGTTGLIAGLTGGGVLAATGSYAGLSRGTYAGWASNVLANGGTARALTKSLVDQMEETIYSACGMMPDIIIMSPSTARSYEALFDSMTRVFVERGDVSGLKSDVRNVGSPVIPSNTGYTGMSYKGIPIYRDRNCPNGVMIFLNSECTKIRVLPQVAMGTSTLQRTQDMAGAPGNNTGISCRVDSLAKLGDSDKFQLVTYLQLQARRPNALGIIKDLI